MSGSDYNDRKEGYDSLLDLAYFEPDCAPSDKIEIIDNSSPTLPPEEFRNVISRITSETIDIITERDTRVSKKFGIPDTKMPVGQEETTQPNSRVDLEEIYALELNELLEENMGEKIAKLLG